MTRSHRLMLSICLLATGLGGRTLLADRLDARLEAQEAKLKRPLTDLPMQIGDWLGTDDPADPQMIADIKIDEYLQRLYIHSSGQQVIVWMSYSTRSADQYHYPTVCMQGVGWTEEEHERTYIEGIDGDLQQPSMYRMQFHRDGEIQSIHYWYYLLGEAPLDRWMRTLSQSSRAFLRGRRNGSLTVEIFSQAQVPDNGRIGNFAKELAAALTAWLPAGTDTDCTLGASD